MIWKQTTRKKLSKLKDWNNRQSIGD